MIGSSGCNFFMRYRSRRLPPPWAPSARPWDADGVMFVWGGGKEEVSRRKLSSWVEQGAPAAVMARKKRGGEVLSLFLYVVPVCLQTSVIRSHTRDGVPQLQLCHTTYGN